MKTARMLTILVLALGLAVEIANTATINQAPIANAGSSRYAAQDPVQLDGTGSFDPDNSSTLSYEWRQISGLPVIIIDANTATPTIGGSMQPGIGRDKSLKISGFTQTGDIQECEFELLVSDTDMTSLPDNVKVIIVPDFGADTLRLQNPPFDRNKPTLIYFGGGNCVTGSGSWGSTAWVEKANIISFTNYVPDPNYTPGNVNDPRTYYRYGDIIIVYLSSVAPDYKQPIQTSGYSTGGQPAIDVGIHLNQIYADARYAVNRVTFLDARACRDFSDSIIQFLAGSVDGEQCWIDNYRGSTCGPYSFWPSFYPNVLRVGSGLSHEGVPTWYKDSLTDSDMNQFNHGVVGGAYWSVIGPGKNLQLASTPDTLTYTFQWYGSSSSGYMDYYDESNHPCRLPAPVTLVDPIDVGDPNGAVLTCEESENAVSYQLLFGNDPYRVMDYNIISDTPVPPNEVITILPFDETWWTVRVRDQYGSTIYADPMSINALILSLPIENLTTGKRYGYIQDAIDDSMDGDEIVVREEIYRESIDFKGKNLTLRSADPNDPAVGAGTVIEGYSNKSLVTFSGDEDANSVLAGFTITGGKRGIYCSGSSPTIINCIIAGNTNDDVSGGGAGIGMEGGSNPTLTNCTIINNSASTAGGGMISQDSSPTLTNCIFSGNSAGYFGSGICFNGGSPILTNCILWSDTPDEIYIFSGTPIITYSDVQGGWAGEGNIDADPLFANPDNGDYHLKSQAGRWDLSSQSWVVDDVTSPCIDTGDPTTPIGLEPLPNGDIINMGAYGGTSKASKSP